MSWSWRWLLSISLLFGISLIAVLGVLHHPNHEYGPDPVEDPNVTATYYDENNSLVFTVVNGSFTSKSGKVFLTNELSEEDANLTLSGYGKTVNTSVWAEKPFLGLDFLNSGITDFPIKEGESVAVKVRLGKEPQTLEKERIFLESDYYDSSAMVTYYSVIDGAAYEMGVVNSGQG